MYEQRNSGIFSVVSCFSMQTIEQAMFLATDLIHLDTTATVFSIGAMK